MDSEGEWVSESGEHDDDMSDGEEADGDRYALQRAQKQESKRRAEAQVRP